MVPLSEGYIFEIAAGTGTITKAMLRRGISHHRLIMVESSKILVEKFKSKFPLIKSSRAILKIYQHYCWEIYRKILTQ
ncbi:hypothetical protein [Candidatus Coxiella mudrowiae]|uniref:hypothetical protein n=1 Tax=Candidatus Coxiella mudrowiae TaxID=2054173 RepID=UPI000C284028|nr:hypothetical protein [Candidatus Coxiella mudrowiae]